MSHIISDFNPLYSKLFATRIVIMRWARWPSGLERWTGDRTVQGSNPTAETFSLRNFGNSVYPALPVSFGGDTQSRRSLLSGVYARGSKRPHQSALECVTGGLHRPL